MPSSEFCQKVKSNVTANFDESLEMYQAFENRYHLFADLAAALADRIHLRPGSAVLDVGCGNGISAGVLNERYRCRVLGVDLSPNMVAAGRVALSERPGVRLVVGDGDRLLAAAAGDTFDYVLYNASIFIFPDVAQTIREAVGCLNSGGKIAFSFYPEISGPKGEDLMAEAFCRLGTPPPRARVLTDYDTACRALETHCGPVHHHRWVRPLDTDFLRDFFSIPAQSASLFPGLSYGDRLEQVRRLFTDMAKADVEGSLVWRMAHAQAAGS